MKKLAALFVVPLFATYLCAQEPQTTQETTTTTTTLNGTLIDAGCRTTHMEHKESSTNTEGTTTNTKTTRDTTDCPATATSTSFGLLTSDGKFVRFDDAGNTRVVEMMKSNKDWNNYIVERKPIKVRVIGAPKGDVVVVREIR